MITVPAGVTSIWPGPDGHAQRLRRLVAAGPGGSEAEPVCGPSVCLQGEAGRLDKVLYWDGQGFCLFAKRLEKGRFIWPVTKEGSVTLTPAQLSMLLEGLEWRAPRKTFTPQLAG